MIRIAKVRRKKSGFVTLYLSKANFKAGKFSLVVTKQSARNCCL